MRISLADADDLVEPLTLDEAKRQVKLETDEAHPDDEDIEGRLIPAVRERAEGATWRALAEATWDCSLDAFPCVRWIELPKPPVLEVVSVTYVDESGVTQTWPTASYVVDLPNGPRAQRGRIEPAYGESWPSTRAQIGAVTIRIRAGYGASDGPALPSLLRHAMLMDLATLYAHREDAYLASGLSTAVSLPRTSAMIYRSYKSFARQAL